MSKTNECQNGHRACLIGPFGRCGTCSVGSRCVRCVRCVGIEETPLKATPLPVSFVLFWQPSDGIDLVVIFFCFFFVCALIRCVAYVVAPAARNCVCCIRYPMGTLRCFDVDTTSIRRRDGISTLYRRRSNVVCPLGTVADAVSHTRTAFLPGLRVCDAIAHSEFQRWTENSIMRIPHMMAHL